MQTSPPVPSDGRNDERKYDPRRLQFISLVIVLCVTLDQATKVLAQNLLKDQPRQEFLGGTFRLQYMENPGAFLGLGSSFSEPVRFWIFVACVSVVMLLMGRALLKEARMNLGYSVGWTSGLALLFSGGLGNLIDRIIRGQGTVVDFMNVGFGSLRTGVFNVADMAILAGIFILLIQPKNKPLS
jgi:signal peptidase II